MLITVAFFCKRFNICPTNILIMTEQKSPIPKWHIPVAILVLTIQFGIGLYYSWIDITWESIPNSLFAVRILTGAIGFVTLMLIIGVGARNAGYTQEFLEKMGDDAMIGKPPL